MPISNEARSEFLEKVKPLKDEIASLLKEEKNELLAMHGKDENTVARGKVKLSEKLVHVATLQIAINDVSNEMLSTKNNDSLNDARKSIYKSIIYLEDLVSNAVDIPYADLEPKQAKVSFLTVPEKHKLVKKIGLAIQLLTDAFGDNSKWKESFVELRGRHIIVAKNLFDMKQGVKAYFDPGEPFHEDSILYIRMLRSLMDKSASEYRDKYELASHRVDDMRTAVNMLIALRRIAMVMSDSNESENIRKKALAWKTKMETDTKAGIAK